MDFLSKLFVCVFLANTFAIVCLGQPHNEDLEDVVKEIVGPDARPDAALIIFNIQQGGPPRTVIQAIKYIPYFIKIARKPTGTGTNQAVDIEVNVLLRAAKWITKHADMLSPSVFPF